ncbi:hypothetical protein ELH43_36655 [Rhizobium ruizarguesonis]|uniref:AAA family ATPase n=1 Tax=Rhizobium ruizarguesonis TaxID=2081791 RepID=UPI0010313581|nr:AAA family ATPase [Rhizobium ruizarguesonis]TBB60672.1 hypothetical protein ELH43_36655 [Rhizobium ruizarguesonis]
MAMWWAQKNQLDRFQIELIEELELAQDYLVLGPPGSGKTNVLLRRAQFTRGQGMPNVLVLTFTRSLTEFLKTGCVNSAGAEIFPVNCITTFESWVRELYRVHGATLPTEGAYLDNKRQIASTALEFLSSRKIPKYDVLFVDEAQDLTAEEVALVNGWAEVTFFAGDDNQRIYEHGEGITALRAMSSPPIEKSLPFHYRLAREICEMASRIREQNPVHSLSATSYYDGPKPGRIRAHKEEDRDAQLATLKINLATQLRVYADLIAGGDKLGVVVRRKEDRVTVLNALEEDDDLAGLAQIVRARSGDDGEDYDPTLDPSKPILILTEHGCKGLEFRAVHWLFVDENNWYRTDEQTYTVVTRAKTTIDLYHKTSLPQTLARAHAEKKPDLWEA